MPDLNSTQRKILITGLFAVGLLSVFLPGKYRMTWGAIPGEYVSSGYHFLFDWPTGGIVVDFQRYLIPVVFVIVATVIGVLVTKTPSVPAEKV